MCDVVRNVSIGGGGGGRLCARAYPGLALQLREEVVQHLLRQDLRDVVLRLARVPEVVLVRGVEKTIAGGEGALILGDEARRGLVDVQAVDVVARNGDVVEAGHGELDDRLLTGVARELGPALLGLCLLLHGALARRAGRRGGW